MTTNDGEFRAGKNGRHQYSTWKIWYQHRFRVKASDTPPIQREIVCMIVLKILLISASVRNQLFLCGYWYASSNKSPKKPTPSLLKLIIKSNTTTHNTNPNNRNILLNRNRTRARLLVPQSLEYPDKPTSPLAFSYFHPGSPWAHNINTNTKRRGERRRNKGSDRPTDACSSRREL